MTSAEVHVKWSVILMDLLGPDIFLRLWMKGQVRQVLRYKSFNLKILNYSKMIQRRALSLATSTNFIQMGQKHRQLFGQKFISNQWPTWNFQMRLLILGRWFGYILLSKRVKWCVILSLEEISDLLFTQFPTAATTATSASSFTCHFSGTPVFAFSALKYDIWEV